jgi:tetratricopeptide (TPR) repeat protein
MRKICFLLLAICLLMSACREKYDRAYFEQLVSMSEPKYNGQPVSSAAIDEIKGILNQYYEKVQQKVKGIEQIGRIYENVAQKYLEIESLLQQAGSMPAEGSTEADKAGATGKDAGIYNNAVGLSLSDRGIYKKALDYLQKAMDVFPANEGLFYQSAICAGYIAKSIVVQGSNPNEAKPWFDKAEANYKKAIQLNPEYLDAYYGYGILLLFELNRPQDAVRYFLTVRERERYNTDVRFALGQAYYALGEYDQAIAMYDEILAVTKIDSRIKRANANKAQVQDARDRQR